jgi:Flp pilus assembly pilin Flp
MDRTKKFFNDDLGDSKLEYAMLVALIAVTIMSAVGIWGGDITNPTK